MLQVRTDIPTRAQQAHDVAARAPGRHAWGRRLGDLILTTDFKQRRCLTVMLMTGAVYAVSMAMMAYCAYLKIFDAMHVAMISAACVLATLVFYVCVRSGWNRRRSEPTLAFPQIMVAQTLLGGAYAASGPVHAGVLVLFALGLVFGMFNMRMGRVRIVTVYTIGLMALIMWWRSRTDPLLYPARLEVIYFILTATTLTAISRLSLQLMAMRERLKMQKSELEHALGCIENMATHDELTGLANRRRLLAVLAEHAARQARGGPTFFVAMLDLDHFKLVNDSHGHAVGDEALRAFAHQARAIMRSTDVSGRWGGEEFLFVLPETPPGSPETGVERLRWALKTLTVSAQAPDLRVTFSCGMTRYYLDEPVEAVIDRADRAMYTAKMAGRDRTVVADRIVVGERTGADPAA